jgi:hypothetical protein
VQRLLWHPDIVLRVCEYCVNGDGVGKWQGGKVARFQSFKVSEVSRFHGGLGLV